MKKQYIGISRDHSGSMASLSAAAMKDYNDSIDAISAASVSTNIETVASVVSQGLSSSVRREVVNTSVNRLMPLRSYPVGGSTPLFDSVGELIEIFKSMPDYNHPDVSFLIIAITDGEENASVRWKRTLAAEIKKLQATDRWTFVFRVPKGYKNQLTSLGIYDGNIQEWETTERGLRESSVQTVSAISDYYTGVSKGIRSTRSFYANMDKVTSNQVRAVAADISDQVVLYPVSRKQMIQPFFEDKTGRSYQKGTAFYQLSKPEKAVQDYKIIVVRNKNTGAVFGGRDARQLLNLPFSGDISLRPGNHGDWDIFVQSTSVNRNLMPGTSALYWEKAS